MPIYEYRCEGCGEQFERLSSWSEADGQSCTRCAEPAQRLISSFASAAACAPEGAG